VLIGPWRKTPEAAIDDAIAAKQARLDEAEPGAIRWAVEGEIEEQEPRAE
jgi:hypothetical protein